MQYIIIFIAISKHSHWNKELTTAVSAYTGNAQEWVYQQASMETVLCASLLNYCYWEKGNSCVHIIGWMWFPFLSYTFPLLCSFFLLLILPHFLFCLQRYHFRYFCFVTAYLHLCNVLLVMSQIQGDKKQYHFDVFT